MGDCVVVIAVSGNEAAGVRSTNKIIATSSTLHCIGYPTLSSTSDRGAAAPHHTAHATLGTLDYD
jgi:hypothetical protein